MLCGTLQPDSIKFLSTARVTSLPSGPNVRLTSPSQRPCSCSPLRSSHAGAITGSDAPSSSRAWISEAAGRGESCFHSPFVLSTRAWARASNSSIFSNTAWKKKRQWVELSSRWANILYAISLAYFLTCTSSSGFITQGRFCMVSTRVLSSSRLILLLWLLLRSSVLLLSHFCMSVRTVLRRWSSSLLGNFLSAASSFKTSRSLMSEERRKH